MLINSLVVGLACLLLTTACDEKTPSSPSVPLNQEFTLAPGQAVRVDDSAVQIQFVRVSGDSRCPADAFCIQGGNALVHVRAVDGSRSEYELHTGDESRATVVHAGLRIQLVNLQPYPFSSRTIEPQDYRATLRVTR
jgi:hypothetical protein